MLTEKDIIIINGSKIELNFNNHLTLICVFPRLFSVSLLRVFILWYLCEKRRWALICPLLSEAMTQVKLPVCLDFLDRAQPAWSAGCWGRGCSDLPEHRVRICICVWEAPADADTAPLPRLWPPVSGPLCAPSAGDGWMRRLCSPPPPATTEQRGTRAELSFSLAVCFDCVHRAALHDTLDVHGVHAPVYAP